MVSLTAANQIATTYDYDKNGRMTVLKYNNQSSELLKGYAFSYDAANNIIKKNDDTFSYDSLNQLLFANLKGKFEVDAKEEVQKVGRVINDFVGDQILDFTVSKIEIIELDYAAGSIGVDLLGTFSVTRVELVPNKPVHRVEERHLTLYGSLDGFEYEKIDNWRLEKKEDGILEIIFGTPVPTRFLKVHSKWDDRDLGFIPLHKGEFKNTLPEMIAVYYQVNQRVEDYQYDAGGNRKQETITLRSSTTRKYSYYPNSNKLMTNGKYAYGYDDNGNLIKKGQDFTIEGNTVVFEPDSKDLWEYEYDLLNRLVKVEKDGKLVAEYFYDEAGLRLKKQGRDSTVYYVFNLGGQVLYEEEENGEYMEYMEYVYVLGKHFARIDGSLDTKERKTYFYHTDHLGSTVLVTDEAGDTVWSSEYTPFGKIAFEEGILKKAAKFTGKDMDEDTGLYYFNARWYDSELGRFISEDPIKHQYVEKFNRTYNKYIERLEQQAKEGNKNNKNHELSYSDYLLNDTELQVFILDELTGNGINLYRYCSNNPVKLIDLDGKKPIKSNWFLGIYAHKAIQADFLSSVRGDARIEVWTPYGRADMALVKSTEVEGWEIKPISYKQNELKNAIGKAQLLNELLGLQLKFNKEAKPGTSYNPDGKVISFPGWKDASITILTDPNDPGMIYYQIDDGLPEGTKINVPEFSLLRDAIKGGWEIVTDFMQEILTPPQKPEHIITPPPLPPLVPVPVF